MIGGDGTPCPARWPDTAGPPTAATRGGRLPHRLRYSTAKDDETQKTTARTPSTDKSAPERGQELAAVSKSNHAGPRTKGAPTPEGQVPAAEFPLRSGTPSIRHLLFRYFPRIQLNHTARDPPPPPVPAAPPRALSPRSACTRPGAPAPRIWHPFLPRLTISRINV